jgi:hypothetical protein
MNTIHGIHGIRTRQLNIAAYQVNLSQENIQEPISLAEQATIDRNHFMVVSKMASISLRSPEKFYESQLSHQTVTDYLEQKMQELHTQYHWLKQADIAHVTDLLNGVSAFRSQFIQKHGTLPSDGRIYREYRSILETAEPEDERANFNVVALEALMNGDIIHGTLSPSSDE